MKDFENFPFCRSTDSIFIYHLPFGVFTRFSLSLNVSRYVEHLYLLLWLSSRLSVFHCFFLVPVYFCIMNCLFYLENLPLAEKTCFSGNFWLVPRNCLQDRNFLKVSTIETSPALWFRNCWPFQKFMHAAVCNAKFWILQHFSFMN